MQIMKTCLLVIAFVYSCGVSSQPAPGGHSIILGKYRTDFMGRLISIEETGKFAYAFFKPCFTDTALPPNRRKALSCGLLYYKLEKYCRDNGIPYNRRELRKYRWRAVEAGLIFSTTFFVFVPLAFDVQNHYNQVAPYLWPPTGWPVFFQSPNAPLIWASFGGAYLLSSYLKAKAERRLNQRLFLPEYVKT